MSYELLLGALRITFQRSVKLKETESPRRLQSYGSLPVALVSDSLSLVPLREDEGVWLGLHSVREPAALRVLIDGPVIADAVSGEKVLVDFAAERQNYVVVPPQQWLDGLTVARFCAKQFVRVAPSSTHVPVGCFRFIAVPLVSGVKKSATRKPEGLSPANCELSGHAQQRIEADPYGLTAWSLDAPLRHEVQLVSGEEFESATGHTAPGPLDKHAAYGGWRLP